MANQPGATQDRRGTRVRQNRHSLLDLIVDELALSGNHGLSLVGVGPVGVGVDLTDMAKQHTPKKKNMRKQGSL